MECLGAARMQRAPGHVFFGDYRAAEQTVGAGGAGKASGAGGAGGAGGQGAGGAV